MKNKKRLSAMVLAAAMTAFSGMAVMAPATMTADAYNVSISNGSTDEATHKYTAYQVFKGDLNDGTLTNVTLGRGHRPDKGLHKPQQLRIIHNS